MGYENIFWLIFAVLTAFLISYISMPVIIKIAGLKEILDKPDNERKSHNTNTPILGGIGIFSAFLISFSFWGNAGELTSYPFFIAALFMLFLTGITDDILVISPYKKLLIQSLAAAEIVIAGRVVITNYSGLLGIYEVPFWVGAFLTVFIIVALVNSFNLIDGIDGLAGGIGIIISGIFGIWFYGAGFYSLAILSFVLSAALLGFLVYNMHPAKIFMGDTGAMAVGFILAFLVVQFIQLNQSMNINSSWYIENAPVVAFSIMIVPVIDTLRVFTIRVLSGKNPFKASHDHTHHKLIDIGILPHYASFSLWIANLFIIAVVFSIYEMVEPTLLLLLVGTMGFMIIPTIKWVYQKIFGFRLESSSEEMGTFISLLLSKRQQE